MKKELITVKTIVTIDKERIKKILKKKKHVEIVLYLENKYTFNLYLKKDVYYMEEDYQSAESEGLKSFKKLIEYMKEFILNHSEIGEFIEFK